MKEALFWKKHDKLGTQVQCSLCPHNCIISDRKVGICRVRKNLGGKLFSLVYGLTVSMVPDPVEKKPLFHFLPGSKTYSFGTVGCNLGCKHCQNWEIAFADNIFGEKIEPETIVAQALEQKCKSIAYTYNEPTVYYEYVYDTARLARKNGLKNIMVTNGFMNPEPAEKLYRYIDAANVDLKGFDEKFYKEECMAHLDPVLESIKLIKKMKVWLELTNLIIPTLNDKPRQIRSMCNWITDNVGYDTPVHFSRFFPYYKQLSLPATPPQILLKARDIAKKHGINYVYIGNLQTKGGEDTYCPKCGQLLVERHGFEIIKNNISGGRCRCGKKIPGIWQ